MEKTHPPFVRTRLAIMMFLEFFIWGGWGFALGGRADNLGFSGAQLAWLVGIPAIGAIVSPLFVGLIADRFFPAQRVLSVLHLLSGVCLIAAGFQDTFPLMMTFMMLHGLFFMPTIALCNSVAFRHIPNADNFPRIAVFGTIGWIVAVLSADVFLGGMKSSHFLFQSGVASFVLALYCQVLPHTPPKGAGAGGDALGLSALKLLKESSFLIFIVCVALFSIPACGYFFALAGPMLQQRGYPSPLALTTLNQFAEIIFMFSMPWFISKLGLKRVLMIGMAAWAVRYLCFACPTFEMAIVGLLLHGFCYSFLYVGAYMYIDKRAPEDLKASAQSLLAFLLLGIGWFVGAQYAGFMKDRYPAEITHMPPVTTIEVADSADETLAVGKVTVTHRVEGDEKPTDVLVVSRGTVKVTEDKKALPSWKDPDAAEFWKYLDLSATVKGWRYGPVEQRKQRVLQLDADKDGTITKVEIDASSDSYIQGLAQEIAGQADSITADQVTEFFEPAQDITERLDTNGDGTITTAEIEAYPEAMVKIDKTLYAKEDLVTVFNQIAALDKEEGEADAGGEVSLTRSQWLKAQSCQWTPIWVYPAIILFIILGAFAIGFRDKPTKEDGAEEE